MPSDLLDKEFGRVREAKKRDNGSCFQDWEVGSQPISLFKLDVESCEQLASALQLAKNAPFGMALTTIGFIWVMNEHGEIWIAVEELALADPIKRRGIPKRRSGQHPADEKKLGHPTLIKGASARIAGELAIEEISGKYSIIVNCSSGRYCTDEDVRPTIANLDAVVLKLRGLGLKVNPNYDDAK
jgi:hypothetical protein